MADSRAGAGKVQDEAEISHFVSGIAERIKKICQKITEASLKDFPLTEFGTI